MTRTSFSCFALISLLAIAPGALRAAEEKIEFPAVSQHAVVKQRVGLTDIEVDYSRPNKNKREIFGGLVPFNQLWRTGANAPTRIKFSSAVKVNGKPLAAGEYALFTWPGEKQWMIMFSKDAQVKSAADYDSTKDAARVAVAPVTLADPVETFTIGLTDLRADAATLFLDWDKTRVAVPVTTDAVEKLTQQLEAVSKSGKEQEDNFYFSAAGFYLEQNKDLTQAAKWIDHAIEKNPKSYIAYYRKAQIQAKLGNKAEAIMAAEKSNEILKAQPKPDETGLRNNQTLIESLR